jgi:hypothetical protein
MHIRPVTDAVWLELMIGMPADPKRTPAALQDPAITHGKSPRTPYGRMPYRAAHAEWASP